MEKFLLHKLIKRRLEESMKQNFVIGIMTLILFLLVINIVWKDENHQKVEDLNLAQYTSQLMIVAVSGDSALLSYYEKSEDGKWELMLETEAIIGKNGLGKTKEGDGKTPVGVFRFTKAFGIKENPGTKMEYTQVDKSHYWVDDAASKYYNQFVSSEEVMQDWDSAEHICEYEEAYQYVLAISYNSERIPGLGSAVFLHCISKGAEATAGCIAIPEVYMKKIIKSVGPECVLIINTADNILNY